MSRINPDPHEAGYVYQPIDVVTAFFPAGQDFQAVVRALSDAGYTHEKVAAFVGEQALQQLDLSGEKHGKWAQFWRGVERAFADEIDVYERVEQVLHSGGSIVAVSTDWDAKKKKRAGEILKRFSGQEITYWGNGTIERLWDWDREELRPSSEQLTSEQLAKHA